MQGEIIDTIVIEKGTRFLETAQELSQIIKALPISSEENDVLIAAILKHADAGRLEAYQQAIRDVFNTDLPEKLVEELGKMEAKKYMQ